MQNQLVDIEAPLLFDTPYVAPTFPRILEALNRKLALLEVELFQTRASGEQFATFRNDDLHVGISLNREPLAPEGFTQCLMSPLMQMKPANLGKIVAGHTGNIFITVGDGGMRVTPELLAMQQELNMPGTRKPANLLLKIKVLHRAILTLLELLETRPCAVHWCQSNSLHLPGEIEATARDDFPITLVTHPSLFSSGTDVSGREKWGFVAEFSDMFCGRSLVIMETAQDLRDTMALCDYLILGHLAGTQPLTEGTVVPFSEFEQARLSLRPPSQRHANGSIEVALEPAGVALKEPGARPSRDFADFGDEAPRKAEASPQAASAAPPAPASTPASATASGSQSFAALRGTSRQAAMPEAAAPAAAVPATEDRFADTPFAYPAPVSPADALSAAPTPLSGGDLFGASTQTRPSPAALAPQTSPDETLAPAAAPKASKLPHIIVGVVALVIFPLIGIVQLGVTLLRGPTPWLTIATALVAAVAFVLQYGAILEL